MKLRPDSALTRLITPIARPPVTIGISITARIPSPRIASSCSGSRIACTSSSSEMSLTASLVASRSTRGAPPGASSGVG